MMIINEIYDVKMRIHLNITYIKGIGKFWYSLWLLVENINSFSSIKQIRETLIFLNIVLRKL